MIHINNNIFNDVCSVLSNIFLITFRPPELVNPLDFGIQYTGNYQNDIDSISSFISTLPEAKDFSKLEDYLKRVYKDTVGVEFEHIHDPAERSWLYYNFEKHQLAEIS